MTIATITPAEEAVARELHALLQEAYTREAEQIGAERFPPLEETVEDLQRSPDTFLGARWCDALIGALSFTAGSAHAVTITRLVVHPAHFRTGIATALLNALEKRVLPATIITVRTARLNVPALALYAQLGYGMAGECETPEKIALVQWTRHAGAPRPRIA